MTFLPIALTGAALLTACILIDTIFAIPPLRRWWQRLRDW